MELPITDFYKHYTMADGYLNQCKFCLKRRIMAYRARNIERIREYDRIRSNTESRKARQANRLSKKRIRTVIQIASEAADPHYRLMWSVGAKVQNALKSGKLIKPHKCETCGSSRQIGAHHEDYRLPLTVIWLCPSCHGQRHREINDEMRNGKDLSERGFRLMLIRK